jgi:[ribosomal protein S18]-alanine N-acetyltransferase
MTITSSPYLFRPMTVADIPRVSEIERESFPSMWPQTAYKRELQKNKLAAYMVACERPEGSPHKTQPVYQAGSENHGSQTGHWRRLLHRLSGAFAEPAPDAAPEGDERIVGFVGLWFMVGEAHIVTIAVEGRERRKGVGEMLLIAAIELATQRDQEVVTLECRTSNLPAQALYEKYGFRKVGVRKRYYTDNDEDALIMTTFPIQESPFRTDFERLRSTCAARHGAALVEYPQAVTED